MTATTPSPHATPAQLDAAAATFDLLSVPGRLHLVWLLAASEYDVTTLAELTGANIPAASQQLAKLRAAGIVTAARRGATSGSDIGTITDAAFRKSATFSSTSSNGPPKPGTSDSRGIGGGGTGLLTTGAGG